MRIIYIRHADKDFSNGNSEYFKHDPGITEIGVERSRKIATQLIELYGEPEQIISSPFRRARETSLTLNSMLKKPLEEIKIDSDLSEYLGNHYDVPLDVTVPTKIHNPPHPETFEQMKKRVKKHLSKFRKKDGVIWIVTHGLIIRQISVYYNIKTSKQIPYLTCFSLLERPDLIRAEFILFKNFPNSENKISSQVYKSSRKNDYDSASQVYKSSHDLNKTQNYKPSHDLNKTQNYKPSQRDVHLSEMNYKPENSSRRSYNKTYKNNYNSQIPIKRLEKTFVSPKTDYTGRDDVTGRFDQS